MADNQDLAVWRAAPNDFQCILYTCEMLVYGFAAIQSIVRVRAAFFIFLLHLLFTPVKIQAFKFTHRLLIELGKARHTGGSGRDRGCFAASLQRAGVNGIKFYSF